MRKCNLLVFFISFSLIVCAHGAPEDTTVLVKPPFYASYGFSQTTHGRVLPASGSDFNVGVNVAAWFRQKYILGVFVEWRVLKFLGSNRKYGRIRSDVNATVNYSQPDARDSARVLFLSDAFNSNPDRHFFGSNQYRYGIIFSPYPDKFGGFLLAVKRGINNYPIAGAYDFFDIVKYESESYIYLDVPVDLSVQLTCKPFLFLYKKRQGKYIDVISQNLFVSVFWDRISMNRARLNQGRLTNFLAPAFFEKNGTDDHFGFKVSLGFY